MAKKIQPSMDFNGNPVRTTTKLILNKFIPKEIDYSYQKNVSFSQFQLYSQCPHRWYTQYVERKISTPPNINMTFGTAIHHAFQHYLTVGYNQSFAAADKEDILSIFQTKFVDEYQTQYTKNGSHFSTAAEMREFYEDGAAILNWFKKRRRVYFTNKKHKLVGIEMPIQKEISKNVLFQGFIDLIIYDELMDKIIIYDIKTSTKGWNDWNKKDETKISQVLLYKQFFSELYGFPVDNIDVEFLILKRKITPNEFIEFPKRIQEFKPASGKNKLKTSRDNLNEFVKNCFDNDGKYIMKEHNKNITKLCDWCPINNTSLCVKG